MWTSQKKKKKKDAYTASSCPTYPQEVRLRKNHDSNNVYIDLADRFNEATYP